MSETRCSIVLRGYGRVRNGAVDYNNQNLYWDHEVSDGGWPLLLSSQKILLLFVGESPDEMEDLMGVPFTGSRGRLLMQILSFTNCAFDFETTNLVACRPTKYSKWSKKEENRAPSDKEMLSCHPRLVDLIKDRKYNGVLTCFSTQLDAPLLNDDHYSLINLDGLLKKEYKLSAIKLAARKIDEIVHSIKERQ